MLTTFLQSVIDGLGALLSAVVGLLPSSPFQGMYVLTLDNELLGMLAYIVPVPHILALLESWTVAVGVFYLYSVVLRWIKAIE